jgi:uroporphyrinogen decarboxylase
MSMTSRERVRAVLDHKIPDRVPIILGVSNATGIKMEPYKGVKRLTGIESEDRYIYDWPELGTAEVDELCMQRLRSDVRGVLDRYPQNIYDRNKNRPPHDPFIDDWGCGQKEIEPGIWYPGVHPMAESTSIADITNYPWPDMNDPSRVAHVADISKALAAANQYAIMATPWLLFPFERAHALQGMDKFLMNMSLESDFAQALLRKILDLCKTHMGNFLAAIGDNIDIIKIGDDLGMQERLLISPRMYRQFLKPLHAEFISFIKERTQAKVFFHTDGDVFDLIQDFIEIGVDILNPVQTSAGRMSDLEGLKSRYGKSIVFCGAIDTQKVLPFGTPAEVRREVRRVINLLGKGGGYMVASVHTIMHEVPPENILAMVDAVEEFGQYPLK